MSNLSLTELFVLRAIIFRLYSQLVRELKQADEAINAATNSNSEDHDMNLNKKSSSKKSSGGKKKQNHDDKNIRRRVYDALNVLMAMDIITKNKKEITWRGLPGSSVQDHLGDGSGNRDAGREVIGLSRRQRVQQLQEERSRRQLSIQAKRECLQELMVQSVCFHNLLGRNHAREFEELRRTTQGNPGKGSDECKTEESTIEKIPLPFIVINTDSKSVVQCEMSQDRTNISFDFNQPFEINDDNEILKRLGM